jgi:hypothetical protein
MSCGATTGIVLVVPPRRQMASEQVVADPASQDPIHGPLFVYRTPVTLVGLSGLAPLEVEFGVFLPAVPMTSAGAQSVPHIGLYRVYCVAFKGTPCNNCTAGNVSMPVVVQVMEGRAAAAAGYACL